MKNLLFGLIKIVYVVVFLIPLFVLTLLDLIRSAGAGKIISDEESWLWKVTSWLYKAGER